MKKRDSVQSGFSLVEVIISLFFVFTIFMLLILEINALSITKKQRFEYIASQVANNQMESLRATSFSNLPASGTISDPLLSQIPSGAGSFSVLDYPNYNGMKEISVTITWSDGTSSKSFTITTLASAQGINQ
jgi:Tfp pilus assembly protein PilV